MSDVSFLLDGFAMRVPGVREAAVVSSDGLVLAMSRGLLRDSGDQLAAVTAGLVSLTAGAARCFGAGDVNQVIVEMAGGYLFVTAISDGSSFAVFADPDADLGLVGYEMSLLVARVGPVLTPELRAELQMALPR